MNRHKWIALVLAPLTLSNPSAVLSKQSYEKTLESLTATPGAQLPDEMESANQNTVSIIAGTLGGTYLAVGQDMSAVLDDGENLRVLVVGGKSGVQNALDILTLRGIDIGIVQSDVMTHLKQNRELGPNVDQRLVYITKLYNEEMHLVGNARIKNIRGLAGKKVNFAESGSDTQFSSRIIFARLGIKVEEVNMNQADALASIKSGEIAGTVFIADCPAPLLTNLSSDPEIRLIAVPFTQALENSSYLRSKLTSEDYPGLIPAGQWIETIAVGALLAVSSWPKDSDRDRDRRVTKFITAFFEKFDQFQKPSRNPQWKDVNLEATMKGWNRFDAARGLLDKSPPSR